MARASRIWAWVAVTAGLVVGCGPNPGGGDSGDVPPDTSQVPIEQPFEMPPLQSEVPLYELSMSQEVFDRFQADPYTVEQPATFKAQGKSWPVMIRYRGSSARFQPKKSWKVDFGEGVTFQGRRKLNLVAEYGDFSMLAEKLGFDLLAALRAPAPVTTYVRLNVNGRYEGVFVEIEQVDKRFLEAKGFLDRDASIYRCGAMDCELKTWKVPYQGNWQKKTNELEKDDHLQQLLWAINHTPEPRLVAELESRVELDLMLRELAMEALISDNLIEDSESYFIEDRVSGKWTYVPWDLNNGDAVWYPGYGLTMKPVTKHPMFVFSLTDPWLERIYKKRSAYLPGYLPVFSNLRTRIAFNPVLRERSLAMVERALDEFFKPEVMHPRIDAIHALIGPYMAQDPYVDHAKFLAGRQYFKDFVTQRGQFLRQEIARYRSAALGLVIEAVDAQQGWVELRNRGQAPATLSGLVLTGDLRRAMTPNLPSKTLAAGEVARFSTSSLGVTIAEDGEVGLFDGVSPFGAIDVLFLGKLPAGSRYQRSASGEWEIR